MKILNLARVKEILREIDIVPAIEEGFIKYSAGLAVIPPVGELLFADPPGDVHIKYGYLLNDDYYVIKVASGFYNNPGLGLSSGNGLNLLFSQKTGELICILLDEGFLTNIRTAAAGAVVAKYLAPEKVSRIGVLGAGIQGKLQVEYLKPFINCRDILVFGTGQVELDCYRDEMEGRGYRVKTTIDAGEVAEECNFIVTATPSKGALLKAIQIKPGTHITAVGSDTPEKQELDELILAKADMVVADSISQCMSRGEIHHAVSKGVITREKIVELGDIIAGRRAGRVSDEQITVADLTGVAVQDLQISKVVYEASGDTK